MIKLHLGCGWRDFGKDWLHIDGGDYPHLDPLHQDLTNLHSIKDNSVDLIYASHVLEYFDRTEVIAVLKEWHRVLKPGATLRLAVPDFEICSKLYNEGKYDLDTFASMFYGKWKITEELTVYHKTIYDFKSFKKILENNGFSNIKLWDWRKTCHFNFDDYSQAYLPHMDKENGVLISLNLECNK